MIRHVPLGKGSEIKHCAQRFWFELHRYLIYELHFSEVSRVFTYSICVVVSGRNLALFLPILFEIHQKIDEVGVKYKYLNGLYKNFLCYHEIAI